MVLKNILMKGGKDPMENNKISKAFVILMVIIVFMVCIIISANMGKSIGTSIGEFIYNLKH